MHSSKSAPSKVRYTYVAYEYEYAMYLVLLSFVIIIWNVCHWEYYMYSVNMPLSFKEEIPLLCPMAIARMAPMGTA